jgi:tRNA threonylcarbamoyladenosine biosynthesis protein TsaB
MISLASSVEALLSLGSKAGPVIGIDTGGPVARLGLVAAGQILASWSRELPSHCAGLPRAVDELVESAGLRIRDLKAVAVAVGPGSFTGLRVGLSYAKGLASSGKLGIVGVPTLDIMALSSKIPLQDGQWICPILDARRGEVYAALYRFSADALEKVTDNLALRPEQLPTWVPEEVVLVGEQRTLEIAALLRAYGKTVRVVDVGERMGGYLAATGAVKVAQNELDDADTLEPQYVRGAGASINSAVKTGARPNGTSRGRTDPALCNS